MADISAIEKSIMGADENTLKVMADSIPYNIYSKLSPEARLKLTEARGGIAPDAVRSIMVGSNRIYLPSGKISELVKQLRGVSNLHENATVMLPTEMVSIIEGRTQEEKFESVSVAKTLRYFADMMEQ